MNRSNRPAAQRTSWQWRVGRWLMIFAALVYGPLPSLIDTFDPGHLTNPTWDGHARLHLLWLIGICGYSGLTAAFLAWKATPARPEPLATATLLGVIIVGSFYTAGLFGGLVGANYGAPSSYVFGGRVGFPLIHFGFAGLLLTAGVLLTRRGIRIHEEANPHG